MVADDPADYGTLARDFRNLRVFRNSFESAMTVFQLSKGWPLEERYSLTDQIRRSSRSVCANIAEGFRKRKYPNHFVSKLSDADAEAGETIVWIQFAKECGYLKEDAFLRLTDRYSHVCAQLVIMMNQKEKWSIE
ncbi:MAG: four helix bundle protein [Planctomycetes bacterium]|nr:four helix bundle protein [Planctomycetota bacterium]